LAALAKNLQVFSQVTRRVPDRNPSLDVETLERIRQLTPPSFTPNSLGNLPHSLLEKAPNMLNVRNFCVAVCLSLTVVGVASAQQTANQTFDVTVPVSLSISAPTASVALTHDKSDNIQNFASQQWSVAGNNGTGVTVSFATATPFTHTANNTYKADARLALSLGTTTGSTFTVTTATDTSNFVANDNSASVAADSNGPGSAQMNLAVSFITGNFNTLAAGTYRTIVTGTIAAK
jgi:hypothetical protein